MIEKSVARADTKRRVYVAADRVVPSAEQPVVTEPQRVQVAPAEDE